jgi:hypothetical protein
MQEKPGWLANRSFLGPRVRVGLCVRYQLLIVT